MCSSDLCCVSVVVSNVSELLGLDSFQLSEVLTQRSMILRGEEICSPLSIEQVGPSTTTTSVLHLISSTECQTNANLDKEYT